MTLAAPTPGDASGFERCRHCGKLVLCYASYHRYVWVHAATQREECDAPPPQSARSLTELLRQTDHLVPDE